jgi:hypothetical protein
MDTTIDLRREERISAVLPVLFLGGKGVTRNVSASGMFVETDCSLPLGEEVDLIVLFDHHAGGPLRVKCAATIVRAEESEGSRGVGAAIRWHAE